MGNRYTGMYSKTPEERFHASYKKGEGCWLWDRVKDSKGYGKFWADGRLHSAHRYSYKIHKEEIPDGMIICHKCDVPGCVNPDHLFAGTYQDNVDDMMKKGRHRPARGLIDKKTKLTKKEVIAIYKSNERHIDLARKYGVSANTIIELRTNEYWNHITKGLKRGNPPLPIKERVKEFLAKGRYKAFSPTTIARAVGVPTTAYVAKPLTQLIEDGWAIKNEENRTYARKRLTKP